MISESALLPWLRDHSLSAFSSEASYDVLKSLLCMFGLSTQIRRPCATVTLNVSSLSICESVYLLTLVFDQFLAQTYIQI